MLDLFKELEVKFGKIETRIEQKKENANSLYSDQIKFLNKQYNIGDLTQKYSNDLNYQRLSLLNRNKINLNSEINHVNEILSINKNINNSNVISLLNESKKKKYFNFKSSLVSSPIAIRKLLIKEYKFESLFSNSKLIKYKHVLELDNYLEKILISKDRIFDYFKLCGSPNLEFVRFYIDSNENKIEPSIIIRACLLERIDILKLLLDHGADVNAKASNNKSLLVEATLKGNQEMVELLMDYDNGADVHAEDNEEIALIAFYYGLIDVANLLLDYGVDINVKDGNGNTGLIKACTDRRLDVVGLLLDYGAEINAKNNDGHTALMKACSIGEYKIVELLLNRGADVKVKDNMGCTALVDASFGSSFIGSELVGLLIKHGADINAKIDNRGRTVLMIAISDDRIDVVELLLESGDDVNARDNRGRTALMKAKSYGFLHIRDLLLEHGAVF